MSENTINKGRRSALKAIVGGLAAIPVVSFVGTAHAEAPRVSETDPAAVGLKYKHDATQAARTDKGPDKADTQLCSNCQFIQADSGEWRGCTMFPGKLVAENGWCAAWAKKA